ncbi:uncharacterized protein [Symphalangus syndactylus]|uniref:uncharacterized protein isoform X1 n=1 Tax=Symphalangus syndactylus TaxID=9590 RepID=UPI003006AF01
MVGGTREVVKPAALGPSDHLPVANACAVAKDNFWRKEGCLQRASDNADKGVALPVRNRRRWERNGWCSGVILAQRSLDFLGSSDPPAPASRVAETTGTRPPAMQGHKLCYAIDYVTYHMISCFCFTFVSQLIKTPLCLCSRLSFLDANPLSQCVPKINNPPVLHISLSGPQFPAILPHWPILGITQGQRRIYHAAKEAYLLGSI